MLRLSLIGIGCGDPGQLTRAAIRAINEADLILIPRKGTATSDLAELRRAICADVLTSDTPRIAEFDLPMRDGSEEDYRKGVDDWHDAVAATVALLHHMEDVWLREEAAGADLLITSGELFTDPTMHAPSKVPGETRFVLDLRSVSEETMDSVAAEAQSAAARIGKEYRVSFDLGVATDSPPAVMDTRLRSKLMTLLDQPIEMPSGAGHDSATFVKVGVPSAMILIRNDHGSHNPAEAMELDDFAVGTRALVDLLMDFPL